MPCRDQVYTSTACTVSICVEHVHLGKECVALMWLGGVLKLCARVISLL